MKAHRKLSLCGRCGSRFSGCCCGEGNLGMTIADVVPVGGS